jgi:multiple sugar transport system permease protein
MAARRSAGTSVLETPRFGIDVFRGLSPARRREAIQGMLFISPWVIGFLAFTTYPMLASLYYSFTDYKILGTPNWVGLHNYIYAVSGPPFGTTGDPLFWLSLSRTVTWVVLIVPSGILGSLLAASLLNRGLVGTRFFRTGFFLPSLTPIVAASLLWAWILQPDIGVLNSVIHSLTGTKGPNWLYSLTWSLPSLLMIALWTGIGGDRMLIFLAGLQGIPQDLYDAAKTDGANAFQRWRHVTVPLISPAILFNLVLGIIGSFRVFALAFVTTQGGPAYATYFYALHLYSQAFGSFDMGYGSTLAWILLVIVLVMTLIQMRLSNRWVYYESQR